MKPVNLVLTINHLNYMEFHFTFHEQDNDISNEINILNARLKKLGYTGMIHMVDLIMRRGDYVNFDINMRREIFKTIFHFSRKVPIKIHSIIVNKNILIIKRY